MEMTAARERKLQMMKENLKLLAVALVVLTIERMIKMMFGYSNPYSDAAC